MKMQCIPEIDNLSWQNFEIFVTKLLSGLGFKNVIHTPFRNDHGVDALATKDDVDYAFRIKHCHFDTMADEAVSDRIVDEVMGGVQFYNNYKIKGHTWHIKREVIVTNGMISHKTRSRLGNGLSVWGRRTFICKALRVLTHNLLKHSHQLTFKQQVLKDDQYLKLTDHFYKQDPYASYILYYCLRRPHMALSKYQKNFGKFSAPSVELKKVLKFLLDSAKRKKTLTLNINEHDLSRQTHVPKASKYLEQLYDCDLAFGKGSLSYEDKIENFHILDGWHLDENGITIHLCRPTIALFFYYPISCVNDDHRILITFSHDTGF